MSETSITVSLHDGTLSKLFAVDVSDNLEHPLKDVEVVFNLGGTGSLTPGTPASIIGATTDGFGRALISVNRLEGEYGDLLATLSARCPKDSSHLRLRMLGMTPQHSRL